MSVLCNIEAVNLDSMLSDCQDLSTIRGGGLAVLNIATDVEAKLIADGVCCEVISGSASQGLLEVFDVTWTKTEELVRGAIEDLPLLEYATVMVSAMDYDPARFGEQRAELKARNRWLQMQTRSVVYPELLSDRVCNIDRVRPATPRPDLPEKQWQSDFTFERRRLGKERKRGILREILGIDSEVVADLNELGGASKKYGNLMDKIAVLKFDGNNFGKISDKCDPDQLKAFSRDVRGQHEQFFRNLVPSDTPRDGPWFTPEGKLRLEMLIYGGDEIAFIVPAWLGWKALECFMNHCAPLVPVAGLPMTYSGGLVFCHSNTPIHAVRDLAGRLADEAKHRVPDKGNYAAYQVLESFDAIGRDVGAFLDERLGPWDKKEDRWKGVVLEPRHVAALGSGMAEWRGVISRRKLHREAYGARGRDIMERGSDAPEGLKALLNDGALGSGALIHLLELWDYVAPEVGQ